MTKSATIKISYDITVRRTIEIDAVGDEIDELLNIKSNSYLQLPQRLISLIDSENSSASEKMQCFPSNITISTIHDDPDDVIIDK